MKVHTFSTVAVLVALLVSPVAALAQESSSTLPGTPPTSRREAMEHRMDVIKEEAEKRVEKLKEKMGDLDKKESMMKEMSGLKRQGNEKIKALEKEYRLKAETLKKKYFEDLAALKKEMMAKRVALKVEIKAEQDALKTAASSTTR
jgi:hypothetical protein